MTTSDALDEHNRPAAVENLVGDIAAMNHHGAFYHTESWARCAESMANAKEVLAKPAPTAEEVSTAYEGLLAAYQGLTLIADNMMDMLVTFVTALDKLVESSFTPESWAPFKAALDEAHRLIDEGDAEDEEIAEVLTTLLEAQENLVPDKAKGLRLVMAEAERLLQDADSYYSGSVKKLQAALDAAKELLKTPMEDLDQKDIDDAALALQDAFATLFEKGDVTALQILIRYAKELRQDIYTTASWQAFAAALKTADEQAAANAMLPYEVDAVYGALYTAIEALVPAGNKSALNSAIAVAQRLALIHT